MNHKSETTTLNTSWSLRIDTILPILAFSIPLLISGPQLLTGSLVNTLLFIASDRRTNRNSLYILSLLPSLGALSNGLLFGKFTPYLVFFIPFIWIGNMVLILSFDRVRSRMTFPFAIIIPSLFKTAILFLSAQILVRTHFAPNAFISSMGAVQLITALIGGTLAYVLIKIARSSI